MLALWFGRAGWGDWWLSGSATSSDTWMLATIYERWAVQVKGGHLPLWFPEFAGGGYPVHAAWMYGLFYPPLFLFTFLAPEAAWTWLAVLHIAFGAAGMFALLHERRGDAIAAACGAIVFAFSNFMVGRLLAGHINLVMPFAWVPWVLLWAGRAARGEPRAAGWLGLCTGIGLLAGHVQVWFYAAPVIVAFALFEARAAGRLREAWRPLVTAGSLALGISAIQWIPAWELFRVSGHPPEDVKVVEGCSAPASALLAQLAPSLWKSGETFAHEFTGLGGPLAVIAVLLAFRLRDGRRVFWFAVLALGLLLAMGTRNPVSEMANDLPPFRFARAPGRALLLVVLAGAVLTGEAVADALAGRSWKWRALVPLAFLASALGLGTPSVEIVKSDFHEFDWTRPLGDAAKEHRVHVLHGRYPYVERFGARTLRDVCPLDTPGYKALTKDPTPAVAWWFDVGTEIDVPWDGRPPADEAATLAVAARSGVKRFASSGGAQYIANARSSSPSDDVVARLRAGERELWIDEGWVEAASAPTNDRPSAEHRVVRLPTSSPTKLSFKIEPADRGWIVLSEKWYPGWMTHDSSAGWEQVPRGNMAFIAVGPSGDARDIEYRPGWLWPALLLSSASLLAALVIVSRRRKPR